jgi:hypothetical protein
MVHIKLGVLNVAILLLDDLFMKKILKVVDMMVYRENGRMIIMDTKYLKAIIKREKKKDCIYIGMGKMDK